MSCHCHQTPFSSIILITHHVEEIFTEISKAVLLKEGRVYRAGNKAVTLSSENLSHIFDTPLKMDHSEGRYRIEPLY